MNGLPSTERFFSGLFPGLLVFMYSEEDPAIASQEYWRVSVMAIGLIVRLDMYEVDTVEGGVIVTLPVGSSGLQCTVTLTVVLTVEGRVAVQVRVWEVPW